MIPIILSTKSTMSQKIKIANSFFIRFSKLRILYANIATFEDAGEGGASAHRYLRQSCHVQPIRLGRLIN